MKVLKIGAVWCSGCLVMKPRWKALEEKHPELQTAYFEYDEHPELAKLYGIQDSTLPVCIFLDKNGKEILKKNGEIPQDELESLIQTYKDK